MNKPERCLCLCELSRYSRVWKEGTRLTIENPIYPNNIVFVSDEGGVVVYRQRNILRSTRQRAQGQEVTLPLGKNLI